MMDSVAAMSMQMINQGIQSDYALGVTKMVMDDMEDLALQEFVGMLPQQQPQVPLGKYIDTYA